MEIQQTTTPPSDVLCFLDRFVKSSRTKESSTLLSRLVPVYRTPKVQWLLNAISEHNGSDKCLLWPFAKTNGYGVVTSGKGGGSAHVTRLAFQLYRGPLTAADQVCHTCDNPPCFNPKRLFRGTMADNMADKKAKGRLLYGERHQNSKFTDSQILEIRRLFGFGIPCSKIIETLGLDAKYTSVWAIATGSRRMNLPNVKSKVGKTGPKQATILRASFASAGLDWTS